MFFALGVLALATALAFLPKLVQLLQAWAMRGEDRTVKIPTGLEVELAPKSVLTGRDLGLGREKGVSNPLRVFGDDVLRGEVLLRYRRS